MQKTVLGLALLGFSLAAQPPALSAPAKASQEVKTTGFTFAVGAAPAWVAPVAEDSAAALPKSPMHYVMIDNQTRIEGESSTAYTHIIRQIDDSAGLGPAAQIQIGFDPSYQTLNLHKIEIVRAGKRIDRLDRKKVKLLQRETRLEARMYDGRVTASVVLDDVRVGDRIEYSYSVKGENPVFGGKAAGDEWLGSGLGPAAVAQFRLLAPESRAIATRAGTGIVTTSTVQGGWRDTRFRRVAAPMLEGEDHMPASAVFDRMVVFSEFADWAAVRDWGARLFAPPPPSPAVQERAAAIRAQAQTPEQRLLLALTLVQKEIRYFGVEIGASSHRPAAPDLVLERRSGDCRTRSSCWWRCSRHSTSRPRRCWSRRRSRTTSARCCRVRRRSTTSSRGSNSTARYSGWTARATSRPARWNSASRSVSARASCSMRPCHRLPISPAPPTKNGSRSATCST